MEAAAPKKHPNPLTYVIPLYFMQAIPVFLVQDVSKTIFKDLGVGNEQIATWTALIALPWSFKLLWGPIVELNSTKRNWTTICQLLIAACIIGSAVALQNPDFFGVTLAVLAVTAIFSATCDIATDGYYLLSTSRAQQRFYVGWLSTMFRLGRLFATGGIVILAGWLAENGFQKNTSWLIALSALAVVYGLGAVGNRFFLPRPPKDEPGVQPPAAIRRDVGRTLLIVLAFAWFYWGFRHVVGLVGHVLSFIPAVRSWSLDVPDMPLDILGITVFQGNGLVVFAIAAALGIIIGLGIFQALQKSLAGTSLGSSFSSFFGQKDIFRILAFVLFYRFGEVMLSATVPLFLQDKKDGPDDPTMGLGFSVQEVGIVNGAWGVIGIVLGGIIGGIFISKIGLKRSFWILAAAMNVPNLLYLLAALIPPLQTVPILAGFMFFDQFGYGFGFAGYLICLQAIAQRNPQFTTAHYAIATGMGGFLIALAGTLAGTLMATLDFWVIFVIVLVFAIPCLLTIRLIPVDETEGIEVRNTDLAD